MTGGAAGIYSGAAAGDLTGNTAGIQRTRREPPRDRTRPRLSFSPAVWHVGAECPWAGGSVRVWRFGAGGGLGVGRFVRLGGFEI